MSRQEMRKRKIGPAALSRKSRIVIACLGLIIIATGALSLAAGRLHYANYWGGMVFAPYAILVGAVAVLVIAIKRR